MATKVQSSAKRTPAKKKETKKTAALPKTAQTVKATGAAKKISTAAKPKAAKTDSTKESAPRKKAATAKTALTSAKPSAAGKSAGGADKRKKSSVKSPENISSKNKSRNQTATKTKAAAKVKTAAKATSSAKTSTPKAAAKKAKKPTASATQTATADATAKRTAKAVRAGKTVAARRAEEARPAAKKETEAVTPGAATPQKEPSEAAKKVARTLIRRKAAKASASEPRKAKPARPIAFTLDEALEIAKTKSQSDETSTPKGNGSGTKTNHEVPVRKTEILDDVKQENRVLGAASISDILGYNPNSGPKREEKDDIPAKYQRYYKLLVELRNHVLTGLDTHTKETLKRSSKEDSGNLSAYSQHMADAGTDTFDRDFALSLVSSEQDALFEIEDAIRRMKQGTYGICEITGKPIKKERLLAVPFAKYSVEGQVEYERTNRKSAYRGGAFSESTEDGVKFMDDDSDE